MALTLDVHAADGTTADSVDLDSDVFEAPINVPVMHQVVVAQMAAARSGTSKTKGRGEVRGGGSKPWRQKGTGRARHGSIRSPMWVGGGVVFGPRPRDHSFPVNKKMRAGALRSALADKAREGRVWILGAFTETKTKAAAACLEKAGIEGRVLIVLDPEDESALAVDRAFRNLDKVAFTLYGALSAYDVLVADAVVFTQSALDRFTGKYQEVLT